MTKNSKVQGTKLWSWIEGTGSAKTSYWLIFGTTIALTVIGAVMVLSASSVENIGAGGSYSALKNQGVYALLGVIGMLVVARIRPTTLKRLAWPAVIGSTALLILVFTPLGTEINGNRNWLRIAGFSLQPAEVAKLALCVWAGAIYAIKGRLIRNMSQFLIPVLPVAGVLIGLVMLGRDLGTVLVMSLILAAILFLAGCKLRYLLGAGLLGLIVVSLAAISSSNRLLRIQAWMGQCDHPTDPCYQYEQGIYALASGGWSGVGLGQSRQKWSYIPEAQNDFIFAILGEELGLGGSLAVLTLFVMLAVGMYRVARRTNSVFIRITTGAIMAWIAGQAFLNIAMVTGLLPVIGVPLPFISAGGTALVMSLLAVGVVLSFAREEKRQQLNDEQLPPSQQRSADEQQTAEEDAHEESNRDSDASATVPGEQRRPPRALARPGRTTSYEYS